jgi:hypothetical protein
MKRILALATFMLACGASTTTTTTTTTSESPQVLPNATGPVTAGDPRSCDHLGPAITSPRAQPAPPVAMAGQMTEQAAGAKRLFDSERWNEAERALGAVARGESGDDVGNKQLAQYHFAIAIYRQQNMKGSYTVFSEIARDRSHIKHHEALLWLVKFVVDHAELVDFADFASYDADEAARFDNPNQRELYWAASFAIGRERLQEGARAEARGLFERVDRNSPLADLAMRCRDRAR